MAPIFKALFLILATNLLCRCELLYICNIESHLVVDDVTGRGVPIYTTHDPNVIDYEVRRAVVAIHGAQQPASNTFCGMYQASVVEYNGPNPEVLVLAIYYKTIVNDPQPDELYWTEPGWKQGDGSVNEPFISSYSVLDFLVEEKFMKNFPNLERVILAGHSAGGQVFARYALGNQLSPQIQSVTRYITANPSTYAYLNDMRPLLNTVDRFEVPNSSECPSYNSYTYGLRNISTPYMAIQPLQVMLDHFKNRDVIYLQSMNDTCTDAPPHECHPDCMEDDCISLGLDKSCSAMFQGPFRYRRGLAWVNFLRVFYGQPTHRLVSVVNVGHNDGLVYQSPEGRQVIFRE